VPVEQGEAARAVMLDVSPAGFEEVERGDTLELAAYVETEGEAMIAARFGGAEAADVRPGWEDAWRAFHRPVRVGQLWVGPPWELVPPAAVAVVIEPGQAFGTGAHATTRLCLELLLDERPASILDVGCGSGVLAIAAAKLDFQPVAALDREQAAVEATRANAARNDVDLAVQRRDALTDPLPAAELAVANLERALVEKVAGRLDVSRLVSSGYLSTDRLHLPGWVRADRRELDGWAAELYTRR